MALWFQVRRNRLHISGYVCLLITLCAQRWLHRSYPVYAFIKDDLPTWYMREHSENEDEMRFTIVIGGNYNRMPGSVVCYKNGPLQGLSTIQFDVMEAWFEEDEQIYIHPKDPYKVRTFYHKILQR